MSGLCPGCVHVRVVESSTGSRFLMCRLAQEDASFSKYPPQPVVHCSGHEQAPLPKGDRP